MRKSKLELFEMVKYTIKEKANLNLTRPRRVPAACRWFVQYTNRPEAKARASAAPPKTAQRLYETSDSGGTGFVPSAIAGVLQLARV